MEKKTVLIIETVKNYPILYDTCHLDHKNNKIKNEIWDNIAEMIEESNGDAVKSRWKNLKDAYSKCLRANKACPGPKHVQRYKCWPWKEHMSFLQPYLAFVSIDSDADVQNETKNMIPLHEESSRQSPVQYTQFKIEETSTSSPFNQRGHSRKRMLESDLSDCESQVGQGSSFLKNKNVIEHDATDLIFLGYARTIKQNMSKRRQAIVKFRIAKIIMEAELEQAEEA